MFFFCAKKKKKNFKKKKKKRKKKILKKKKKKKKKNTLKIKRKFSQNVEKFQTRLSPQGTEETKRGKTLRGPFL